MNVRMCRVCARRLTPGALARVCPDCFDGRTVAGVVCRCGDRVRRPMQRRIGDEVWLVCERCFGRIRRLDDALYTQG